MTDPKVPCLSIDRAKFAAREYIADVERAVAEAGATFQADRETTVLAYESGYLRGSNDAHEDLLKDLKELRANARENGRLESETERLKLETDLLQREAAALQRLNEAEQQLLEALQRENEALERLVRATDGMRQLEERLAVLEARR